MIFQCRHSFLLFGTLQFPHINFGPEGEVHLGAPQVELGGGLFLVCVPPHDELGQQHGEVHPSIPQLKLGFEWKVFTPQISLGHTRKIYVW